MGWGWVGLGLGIGLGIGLVSRLLHHARDAYALLEQERGGQHRGLLQKQLRVRRHLEACYGLGLGVCVRVCVWCVSRRCMGGARRCTGV